MNVFIATSPFKSSFESSLGEKINVVESESDVKSADLVIFSGGEDISPEIYDRPNTFSYCDVRRDRIELQVLIWAIMYQKKILGVCRGHQLINATFGFPLIQDLGYENQGHSGNHKLEYCFNGAIVASIFDKFVNSMHHQGFSLNSRTKLSFTAYHKDVSEICESNNIITTQFHPEFMNTLESKNFWSFIKEWPKKKVINSNYYTITNTEYASRALGRLSFPVNNNRNPMGTPRVTNNYWSNLTNTNLDEIFGNSSNEEEEE